MSGGGNGGGRSYQPQDNTAMLMQAQREADERAAERERTRIAEQRHYDTIRWQEQIDADKTAAQIARNQQLEDQQRERQITADREFRTWNDAYQQRVYERSERDRIRNQEETERTQRLDRANRARTTVDSSARALATSRLNSLGINDKLPDVMSQYDRILAGIPEGDPNPGAYYSSDLLNSIISDAETQRRSGYVSQVNNTFAPGFERTYIPDTADDSYIDRLLTGRQGEAQKSIDFARARGQLNDAGYSGAQAKLGEQSTAARGTLNSIGNSILGTKRAALTPIRDQAYGQASSYRLGEAAPDFGRYSTQASTQAQDSLAGLEGDILGALGNTSLFNINDIILAGGRGQGPQNLTTANVPARLKKNTETDRGLGTTGAF